MATTSEFIATEFALSTYEERANLAKAELELAAAETVEKMYEQGFTEEEINSVLKV
jgi:hypothetical protein